MQIIGAGFGRTGTMWLTAALEQPVLRHLTLAVICILYFFLTLI